jgi:heat shock protein HtpX
VSVALLGIIFWVPEWVTYFGLTIPEHMKPILLMAAGATGILRTWYRYHGEFQPATVGSLIEDVEVSQMRPRAVRLKGQIVGRGVPGAFWSSDLVLRDPTGILFVLYRQSIPLARFMFAITEAENYIGQEVEIEGWFRRGLSPYVEMSLLKGEYGDGHRAYSRWIQYGLALVAIIVGCYWLQL